MAENGKAWFRMPVVTARGMRWALVLSVVLNLVLGGVIIGSAFHGGPPSPPGDVVVRMVRALPSEVRHEMRRDWMGREDRQSRSGRGDFMRGVIGAISAEPFDPEALDRQMASFQQGSNAALGALRVELVSRIAAMTPDQRAAYVDALRGDDRGRHR